MRSDVVPGGVDGTKAAVSEPACAEVGCWPPDGGTLDDDAAAAGPTAPRGGAVVSVVAVPDELAEVGMDIPVPSDVPARSGGPSAVARTAAGTGSGARRAAGSRPPTTTVTSPATVSTDASATQRRRRYTAAGSGPTGSHIHSMYRNCYSE